MGRRAVATVALTIGGCAAASASAAAAAASAAAAATATATMDGDPPADTSLITTHAVENATRSALPTQVAARSRSTQHQRIALLFRDDDVARGEPGPGLRVCWSIKGSALARQGQQGDGDIAGVAQYFALKLYGEEKAGEVEGAPKIRL